MRKLILFVAFLLSPTVLSAQWGGWIKTPWRIVNGDSSYTNHKIFINDNLHVGGDTQFDGAFVLDLSSTQVTRFVAPGGDTLIIGPAGFSATNSYAAGPLALLLKDGATIGVAIDTSFNLGVGTASMAYSLHIKGNGFAFEAADGTQRWDFFPSGVGLYIDPQVAEGDLFFRNFGNAVTLQLDNSENDVLIPNGELIVSGTGSSSIAGNVGLGTTAPRAQYSQEGATPQAYWTDTDINKARATFAGATDTSAFSFSWTNTGKPLFDIKGITGNAIVSVDSAGNYGIGTAAPLVKLHIVASGGTPSFNTGSYQIIVQNSGSAASQSRWGLVAGTSGYGILTFGIESDEDAGGAITSTIATGQLDISTNANNGNIVLTPNGTGKTILNGNVGIGDTAPVAILTVKNATPTFAIYDSDIEKTHANFAALDSAGVTVDVNSGAGRVNIYGTDGDAWNLSINTGDGGLFSGAGGGYVFDNTIFLTVGDIVLDDQGTSINSGIVYWKADNAGTVQTGTVQVIYGADPYLRISAPNDAGTATPMLDLKDQKIIIGNAGAGVDYVIEINGETNDGVITFLEDEKTWQFDAGISLGDTVGFVLTAPGAATVSSRDNIILDTSGGAVLDTAVTLTGVIGQVVYISSRNAARDIVFQDTGNFSLGALRTLSDPADVLVMKFTSATTLKEVSFADNN